jgi:hypothetical protein
MQPDESRQRHWGFEARLFRQYRENQGQPDPHFLQGSSALQIARLKPRVLGNARKHSRTDFLTVVKCEHEIFPAVARKRAMRAGLPLESPPNAKKGGKNTVSLSR